jgi:TolB-like protein/class 3 adenylate cyclase/Tfp pilus assembly protein PilF
MAASSPRVERHLAAVLAADVAGYSRLMERDEVGTLARLTALRRGLVEPLVAEHGGRIVKLMGDGTLCEFASVVDAVACAVRVQEGFAERQADVPERERIALRVGVNLGDVIVEDGDIYGDGVNVAARLEQMAEPGSVLVSGTAYDQVEGKLDLPFEPLGERRVKNIARPVRVYRVRPGGGSPAAAPARGPGRVAAAAALAGLLLLGAGGVWWRSGGLDAAPSGTEALLPASTRPSLAVLPLDNLSGDPSQQRLADGLTEDLITELARFRDIAVVARNSTAVYGGGRGVDVRQVGRDLGVRYVLEGSLQTDPDRVRITAQLIDASSGVHVWSERYDRPLGQIFALRDEVVGRIAATLSGYAGPLHSAEREAARRKPPDSLQAYDYYLLAKEAAQPWDRAASGRARPLVEQALVLDPDLARAWSFMAFIHLSDAQNGWSDDPARSWELFHDAAARAVRADPMDAGAYVTVAGSHFARGETALGAAAWDRALALGPNDAHVLLAVAGRMAVSLGAGRAEEGLALVRRSLALNPLQPAWKLGGVGVALYHAGEHREAADALGRNPTPDTEARLYLALANGRLGRSDEARAVATALLRDRPGLTAEGWVAAGAFAPDGSSAAQIYEGARGAGLPLCGSPEEAARLSAASRPPECEAERARAARS